MLQIPTSDPASSSACPRLVMKEFPLRVWAWAFLERRNDGCSAFRGRQLLASAVDAPRNVVEAMSREVSVTVIPHDKQLTGQETAEI
jgi:hypothetical protein